MLTKWVRPVFVVALGASGSKARIEYEKSADHVGHSRQKQPVSQPLQFKSWNRLT